MQKVKITRTNRVINAVISVSLGLSILLTGCDTSSDDGGDDVDDTSKTVLTDAGSIAKTDNNGFGTPYDPDLDTFTNPPEPIEIPYDPYVPSDHGARDVSSIELVAEIKTGWSLGNTFDVTAPTINAETSWGNPRTTFAMIKAVSDAGFDLVRIPVTWQRHMGEAPDYTIDEEWLNRVEEVVGYVLSTGMYCILNTHHEDWIYPTEEKLDKGKEQLIKVWEQLSERFDGYNEKLIFEGLNEPRLRDTPNEWNGGTPEAHEIVNTLNKAFVDTVRTFGKENPDGNTALRHLMITTYAGSIENAPVMALSKSLSDYDGDNKIIATVHAYTPNVFALNPNGVPKWSPNTRHQWDIDWMFSRIKENFVDKGIPVIIGETGAVGKEDNLSSRIEWTEYYFQKAREFEIPACWWDNGMFYSGKPVEAFGLLNRRQAVFETPEIIDAIMK